MASYTLSAPAADSVYTALHVLTTPLPTSFDVTISQTGLVPYPGPPAQSIWPNVFDHDVTGIAAPGYTTGLLLDEHLNSTGFPVTATGVTVPSTSTGLWIALAIARGGGSNSVSATWDFTFHGNVFFASAAFTCDVCALLQQILAAVQSTYQNAP